MKTVIKKVYSNVILSDVNLQVKIAEATKKTIETVKRWACSRNEYLLMVPVQDVIREHLKLSDSVIMNDQVDSKVVDAVGDFVGQPLKANIDFSHYQSTNTNHHEKNLSHACHACNAFG